MSELFQEMFDEGAALMDVEGDSAKRLAHLVRTMRGLEDQIEDAENHIKALKAEKHRLTTEIIPQLMDEMGMQEIKVDGMKVAIKPIIHASIPADKKDAAFAWLRETGHDDIIKNDVILTFGKGQDNVAGALVDDLRQQGFDPQTKTHVHPMTLKAFIREQLEKGEAIDLDLFGAYVINAAEIRRK